VWLYFRPELIAVAALYMAWSISIDRLQELDSLRISLARKVTVSGSSDSFTSSDSQPQWDDAEFNWNALQLSVEDTQEIIGTEVVGAFGL